MPRHDPQYLLHNPPFNFSPWKIDKYQGDKTYIILALEHCQVNGGPFEHLNINCLGYLFKNYYVLPLILNNPKEETFSLGCSVTFSGTNRYTAIRTPVSLAWLDLLDRAQNAKLRPTLVSNDTSLWLSNSTIVNDQKTNGRISIMPREKAHKFACGASITGVFSLKWKTPEGTSSSVASLASWDITLKHPSDSCRYGGLMDKEVQYLLFCLDTQQKCVIGKHIINEETLRSLTHSFPNLPIIPKRIKKPNLRAKIVAFPIPSPSSPASEPENSTVHSSSPIELDIEETVQKPAEKNFDFIQIFFEQCYYNKHGLLIVEEEFLDNLSHCGFFFCKNEPGMLTHEILHSSKTDVCLKAISPIYNVTIFSSSSPAPAFPARIYQTCLILNPNYTTGCFLNLLPFIFVATSSSTISHLLEKNEIALNQPQHRLTIPEEIKSYFNPISFCEKIDCTVAIAPLQYHEYCSFIQWGKYMESVGSYVSLNAFRQFGYRMTQNNNATSTALLRAPDTEPVISSSSNTNSYSYTVKTSTVLETEPKSNFEAPFQMEKGIYQVYILLIEYY